VVVWDSFGQDGSSWSVYGQRFDSDGKKVGSEFRVNTWTTLNNVPPSVTSLRDGGFVVVWESLWQGGSTYGVYGQMYDFNGNKVGPEFQVHPSTTAWHESPSIASLTDGGFVVVWDSNVLDGSYLGVYGQRFDSNGNKIGSEFRVNTWTTDWQENPSIASLPDGGFVVVWSSGCGYGWEPTCTGTSQDGSSWGVYGQRFDSNGNKVGSEFQVNTWTTGDQYAGSIASLPDGGFVVVWSSGCSYPADPTCTSTPQDGSGWGVYGQRFDSNGRKVGSEFQVNTRTTLDQLLPSITSFPDGGFLVVWESWEQDGSDYGVYGQRFDSDGNKVGYEFQVNTWTMGGQRFPCVASLPNSGFVVVWESGCDWEGCIPQDGSFYGVYGRVFSQ